MRKNNAWRRKSSQKKEKLNSIEKSIIFKMNVRIDYNFCGLKNELKQKKKILLLSFIYCEGK